MNTKTIFAGIAIPALFTLALIGCGGAEQSQSETQPMDAESHAVPENAQAYPIDYCIVSGEELGGMGDPIELEHQGRTIKFCCQSCVRKFKAEPAYYLAKLDSAAVGLLKQPGSMQDEGHDHEGHTH